MKKIYLLLILCFSSVTSSFGCECITRLTLEEQFKEADIVFYAKVVNINDSQIDGYRSTLGFILDSIYTKQGGYQPELMVFKVYKGQFKKPLINKKYQFNSGWSICDVYFRKDQEYIIFGYFDEKGDIQTNVCTPTGVVADKSLLTKISKL
jgi:hypothetical protein